MSDLSSESETQFVRRQNAWERIMVWKMAVFQCSGKALIAVALSVVASLNGNEWSAFSSTQKLVAWVTAVATGWQVVDAFLSTTMSDMKKDIQSKATVTTTTQ